MSRKGPEVGKGMLDLVEDIHFRSRMDAIIQNMFEIQLFTVDTI